MGLFTSHVAPFRDRQGLAELERTDPQPNDIFADLRHLRNKREMINAEKRLDSPTLHVVFRA